MIKRKKVYLVILVIMSGIGIILSGFQLVMNNVADSMVADIADSIGKTSGNSVTIIGGADGPTSIFLARDIGSGIGIYVGTGILLLVTVVSFYIICKARKNRKVD